MNAKTAKKLRKIATGMVVAAEQKTGKQIEKVAYVVDKNGTRTVAPNTWKGAYKSLKKGLRKAAAGSAFAKELTTVAARKNAVAAL